jgi:hypothetical protein
MRVILILSAMLIGFADVGGLSLAQPSTIRAKVARFVPPPTPPGPAPGGRVRGGARRTECFGSTTGKTPLTALVPATQQGNVVNVWALTTSDRPTLWFYVPYTQSSGGMADFVLQDEDANPIYETNVNLPQQPGVIGVSTKNAPALQVGKRYRWFLNIYCDQKKESFAFYVEGVIQRTNLNATINQKLQTASLSQQVGIYAENSIWHEAITILAQLRQKNPTDASLQAEWQNLLEGINLGDVAGKAIVVK